MIVVGANATTPIYEDEEDAMDTSYLVNAHIINTTTLIRWVVLVITVVVWVEWMVGWMERERINKVYLYTCSF